MTVRRSHSAYCYWTLSTKSCGGLKYYTAEFTTIVGIMCSQTSLFTNNPHSLDKYANSGMLSETLGKLFEICAKEI